MGFIETIAPLVQKYAPQYGIKVCSPIIAQAILESASGTSELAVNAMNFFGLKYRPGRCPSSNGIYQKFAHEQRPDGSYVAIATTDWFKFPNMEAGVKGYFDFINISNYANLKGVTDPKTYLELIKQDKYATSNNYVEKVMAVLVKNNLQIYDTVATTQPNSNNGGTQMAQIKIAIDAGHGSQTAGKRTPDGYREHWINVKTAYYCEQYLQKHGIATFRVAWDDTDATDDVDVPLSTRQAQIKAAKCDYSISFHANAHGSGGWTTANGVETLISNNSAYQKDSLAFAQKVQNRLIQGTKQANRGVKKQSLAMCNCPAMGVKAACLVEIGFMTNQREAELMRGEAFCKEQGEDAARGILDYLGIADKAPQTTTPSSTTTSTTTTTSTEKKYYRVNCGSYKNKANAVDMQNKLKKAGYSSIIKEIDGYLKVQVGAYSVKANADAMMKKIKASGFSAFITYC